MCSGCHNVSVVARDVLIRLLAMTSKYNQSNMVLDLLRLTLCINMLTIQLLAHIQLWQALEVTFTLLSSNIHHLVFTVLYVAH